MVSLFRAQVVDVAPDAVTIEVTGNRDKLDALLRVLEPYGVKELVQSGRSPSAAAPSPSPTGRCARRPAA